MERMVAADGWQKLGLTVERMERMVAADGEWMGWQKERRGSYRGGDR